MKTAVLKGCVFLWLLGPSVSAFGESSLALQTHQVTSGPKHHFFGYIGHVGNIPWSGDGRFILGLQTEFQDRLPSATEAAEIFVLDTRNRNELRVVDRTLAWNPQQGTMMYWNPQAPDTQFFFNDRDPQTGHVFCVLFDLSAGSGGRRIHEYRYEDTPFGNSGVAQSGGSFLGINYGRLARLRPVTGYPEAYDWTIGEPSPEDDGIFKVDLESGQKQLLVSYRTLAEALRPQHPDIDQKALFINHTLWNREGDRIFFFARADFETRERINASFTMAPDGTGLRLQKTHIGGHPEWDRGHRMIGRVGDDQVVYDTDTQEVVATLGDPSIFPKPEGDIALSPDGDWLVNGYREGNRNRYVVFRRADGAFARTTGFDVAPWLSGPLRIDAAPCWNRESNRLLFPALAEDPEKTRQMFMLEVKEVR